MSSAELKELVLPSDLVVPNEVGLIFVSLSFLSYHPLNA